MNATSTSTIERKSITTERTDSTANIERKSINSERTSTSTAWQLAANRGDREIYQRREGRYTLEVNMDGRAWAYLIERGNARVAEFADFSNAEDACSWLDIRAAALCN